MREILFRGKRLDNGEWIEGYYANQSNHACFSSQWKCQHFIFKDVCLDFGLGGLQEFEIDPSTVGQYIGLTDKNGKKIFEGDIIKSDNGVHNATSVVKYGDFEPDLFYSLIEEYIMPRPKEKLHGLYAKTTRGEDVLVTTATPFIEVIGNIYDNSELLKMREVDE